MVHRVMFSSEKDDWLTPKHIVTSISTVMGGIDMDPCADLERRVPATVHYTEKDDGLSKPWIGRVFMNPPYGKKVAMWATKWKTEYDKNHFSKGIALVASRTDTQWWRDIVSTASVVCFIDGRIKFGDDYGRESTPATFPSALLYACRDSKTDVDKFAKEFSKHGNIWIKHGVVLK